MGIWRGNYDSRKRRLRAVLCYHFQIIRQVFFFSHIHTYYVYTSVYSPTLAYHFHFFLHFHFPLLSLSITIFPLFFPFSALLLQSHSILAQSSKLFLFNFIFWSAFFNLFSHYNQVSRAEKWVGIVKLKMFGQPYIYCGMRITFSFLNFACIY